MPNPYSIPNSFEYKPLPMEHGLAVRQNLQAKFDKTVDTVDAAKDLMDKSIPRVNIDGQDRKMFEEQIQTRFDKIYDDLRTSDDIQGAKRGLREIQDYINNDPDLNAFRQYADIEKLLLEREVTDPHGYHPFKGMGFSKMRAAGIEDISQVMGAYGPSYDEGEEARAFITAIPNIQSILARYKTKKKSVTIQQLSNDIFDPDLRRDFPELQEAFDSFQEMARSRVEQGSTPFAQNLKVRSQYGDLVDEEGNPIDPVEMYMNRMAGISSLYARTTQDTSAKDIPAGADTGAVSLPEYENAKVMKDTEGGAILIDPNYKDVLENPEASITERDLAMQSKEMMPAIVKDLQEQDQIWKGQDQEEVNAFIEYIMDPSNDAFWYGKENIFGEPNPKEPIDKSTLILDALKSIALPGSSPGAPGMVIKDLAVSGAEGYQHMMHKLLGEGAQNPIGYDGKLRVLNSLTTEKYLRMIDIADEYSKNSELIEKKLSRSLGEIQSYIIAPGSDKTSMSEDLEAIMEKRLNNPSSVQLKGKDGSIRDYPAQSQDLLSIAGMVNEITDIGDSRWEFSPTRGLSFSLTIDANKVNSSKEAKAIIKDMPGDSDLQEELKDFLIDNKGGQFKMRWDGIDVNNDPLATAFLPEGLKEKARIMYLKNSVPAVQDVQRPETAEDGSVIKKGTKDERQMIETVYNKSGSNVRLSPDFNTSHIAFDISGDRMWMDETNTKRMLPGFMFTKDYEPLSKKEVYDRQFKVLEMTKEEKNNPNRQMMKQDALHRITLIEEMYKNISIDLSQEERQKFKDLSSGLQHAVSPEQMLEHLQVFKKFIADHKDKFVNDDPYVFKSKERMLVFASSEMDDR